MINNSFLYRIAEIYYKQYGSDISRFSFVFPNRRAGLFFRRYLTSIIDKNIFSPEILSINDCFSAASEWQTADRLSNLFRLFRIYKEQSSSDESFDNFIFWGEMLLSDFDEIDKYMVDARQIFTNITELKEIDQVFNTLTPNQIEAIQEFWKSFLPVKEGNTSAQFVSTWKILYQVYDTFQRELKAEGLATEGMICRNVVERLEKKEEIAHLTNKQFVFIGFNALNVCEKRLMLGLQKLGIADFYWDYEAEELRNSDNPASLFYKQNTTVFSSKFEIEPYVEKIADKDIELISVPSAIFQTKQIHSLLNKIYPPTENIDSWINTAVVLPDENLLTPLLHSIPEQIEKVNVTMGFPLSGTPVSSLIEHIFELQRRLSKSGNKVNFYHQSVSNVLNHQYIALLCKNEIDTISSNLVRYNWIYIDEKELQLNDVLSCIFQQKANKDEFLPYLIEIVGMLHRNMQKIAPDNYALETDFLYQYYSTLNRMWEVMKMLPTGFEMTLDTLMRLIRQLVSGISIPFVGEPLEGLQIMGVLEARGIDFENLIIPSFNEGVFPKKTSSNSYIPYNLRKGFGLPTYEHNDAITSYNFYRLIHRAKKIYMLYDSRTDGMSTGEESRFLKQLHFHYGVNIKRKSLIFETAFAQETKIEIDKTDEIMKKLQLFVAKTDNAKALSASSIKTYIDCPLMFYLTRIEHLETVEEVSETIEESVFGNLFHATMEYIYKPFKDKIIQGDDLDKLIANSHYIDQLIHKAFCVKYFKKEATSAITIEGNNLLIARVIKKYVTQVLRVDKKHAPFKIVDVEKDCTLEISTSAGIVNIKGFIDRIDEKEGKVRIIDYKTGQGDLNFRNMETIFAHNIEVRPKHVLQTLLYGLFYEPDANGKTIVPGIYYMRNLFKEPFETELTQKIDKNNIVIDDFSIVKEEYTENLIACLEEIFDPTVPFTQTKVVKTCEYCDYKAICKR